MEVVGDAQLNRWTCGSGWDPAVGEPARSPAPAWLGLGASAALSALGDADSRPDRQRPDRSGPPEALTSVPPMAIQAPVRWGGRQAALRSALQTGLNSYSST